MSKIALPKIEIIEAKTPKDDVNKDPNANASSESSVKVVGVDHKGEEVLSNKRDIPKGKGEDPKYNPNNANALDGPVPASKEDNATLVLHPPVDLKSVARKDKIGLKK